MIGKQEALDADDGRRNRFLQGYSISTHQATNIMSRFLLHELQVETAPLAESGR